MHFRTLRTLSPLITATALLFAGGCSSHHDYVPDTNPKTPPAPAMQGYGEFFDGKLMVEASLGRGFRMRPGKMRDFMGRSHGKGGGGAGRVEIDDASDEVYYEDQGEMQQRFIPRMSSSTLPPVALRVRVTNQTQQSVDVVFLECNSVLGNFAVRPEKITIAAGETGAPDPMTSLLGVGGTEIQLRVGLKMGDAKETQTIVLRTIKTAPPPPESEKPAAP